MTKKWFVTCWATYCNSVNIQNGKEPKCDIPDDLDTVWTISRDHAEGWETDGGCPGYGLTKIDAMELADAANNLYKNQ